MGLMRGDRYSRGAIAFHWVIAALVLFNLWLGLFHDALPREWKVMPLHKSLGVTILVLSIGRLAWRLMHKPPHFPARMPGWEKAAAKAAHWLFYALLLILPLSGWVFSSDPDRTRVISWFGLLDLPVLPVSHAVAEAAKEGHEILGWAMAILVAVHILAALRHHLILRDDTLKRILPRTRRNG
jgi:cytochrome b561